MLQSRKIFKGKDSFTLHHIRHKAASDLLCHFDHTLHKRWDLPPDHLPEILYSQQVSTENILRKFCIVHCKTSTVHVATTHLCLILSKHELFVCSFIMMSDLRRCHIIKLISFHFIWIFFSFKSAQRVTLKKIKPKAFSV